MMLSYAPRALALVVDAVHNIDLRVQSGSGKRPRIVGHAANPGRAGLGFKELKVWLFG